MVTPADKFAISSLLLPTHGSAGEAYFERVAAQLTPAADGESLPRWVAAQLDTWRTTLKPSKEFQSAVETILFDEGAECPSFVVPLNEGEQDSVRSLACREFSTAYFRCVGSVMQEDGLSLDEARGIVSQTGVIIAATIEAQQSAARIHHNLTKAGVFVGRSYRVPRLIMSAIGHPVELSEEEVMGIFAADRDAEPDLLADLSIEDSISYIGEVASDLGCTTDIAAPLSVITASEQRHDPYLIVLHFQLTTAVKYDSLLIDLYEFSPRSERVNRITEVYNQAGLEGRSNPYLNNFKSVELLTRSWANTKQNNRFAAHALVELIEVLDGLAPLQRQTIGALIRGLLHRIVRISSTDPLTAVRVPQVEAKEFFHISQHVAEGNTSTLGIVEQRYVDAVVTASKRAETNWRDPKGLGDSVNASNVSRKKFGDIEFKHSSDTRIAAFEAHGGVLTLGYVQEHLNSLPYILEFRRAELEDRASIDEWRLSVVFVAHEFRDGLPERANILGMEVSLTYCTYEEIIPTEISSDFLSVFNTVFVDRLNAIETPHRIRLHISELVASAN